MFSFIAAALSLTAVSCMKETTPVETPAPAGESVVFTAATNSTKTAIAEGNKAVWVAGDKITIHNGTQGYEFTTADAGMTAKFEYTGNDFSGEKFMAVYPEGTYTADVNAKTVVAHVPTYQEATAGTHNPKAALAVSYTEDKTLHFKNATALIKFKVIGQKVKGLIFYGHNNEAVSGNVLVSLNEDNTIKSVVGQETEITEGEVTETKYITWAKVWAPTSSGNYFVDGETYYLAVVPQNFENGFTFQLEVDGVGNVDVLKYETAYELKPNTILNIGEVSAWSVAGSFNDWNATANPMKREGDYYVIKNVTNLHYTAGDNESSTGFKFVADGNWKGTGANDGKMSTGAWEYIWGSDDKNIYVEGAAATDAFDIYVNPAVGDNGQFIIVPAGEGIPEPAPVWSVAGTFNNWNAIANPMELEGDYYVIKNVRNLHYTEEDNKSKTGFKFVHNGTWTATGNNSGKLTSKVWEYNWDNNNDYNMYVDGATAEQAFDIYLNPNEGSAGKFVVVPAGEGLPEPEPEPEPENPTPDPETPKSVRIYISNAWGWGNLWCWDANEKQIFGDNINWPGTKYHGEENGYYYWNVPEKYIGKTVSIIANNVGKEDKQSATYANVTLDKNVYFYLAWTQEKGEHLVKENK